MAAATPKTPSDAQPTSENITYEATLNAAASASRFPAGAFLDYAGLKKILEALAEMYATGDRPTEGLAYASLATTAAAPRGPTSLSHSEVCCSVWNAALSEALRRLGYYARRVNSPLSVPRAP